MRILYVTTIGGTMVFFKTLIPQLIEAGHKVDIAANYKISDIPDNFNNMGCKCYQIDWSRNPLAVNNYRAIKQLRTVVEENKYDIVHCHTPVAAACTRLACRRLRKQKKVKVIYTAHGFHFFSGAPLKNWMIFYPIEKLCAHMTDVLITINKEDYERAKRKLKAGKVEYVPGVGIDIDKFSYDVHISEQKRKELQIEKDDIMLLSVGELSKRKNHEIVIRAIKAMENKSIKYFIVGEGERKEYLSSLIESMEMQNQIMLLSYRNDISELCQAADLFVFPSYQEGLPVALMEAIACHTPIACSEIRGNKDLILEKHRMFNPKDKESVMQCIKKCVDVPKMSEKSRNECELQYERLLQCEVTNVNAKMKQIYNTVYDGMEVNADY